MVVCRKTYFTQQKRIVGNGRKLRFQQHWWEAKFKGTPTFVTCRKRRITQQIFAVAVVVIVNKNPNLRFHQRWWNVNKCGLSNNYCCCCYYCKSEAEFKVLPTLVRSQNQRTTTVGGMCKKVLSPTNKEKKCWALA